MSLSAEVSRHIPNGARYVTSRDIQLPIGNRHFIVVASMLITVHLLYMHQ